MTLDFSDSQSGWLNNECRLGHPPLTEFSLHFQSFDECIFKTHEHQITMPEFISFVTI